MVFFHIPIPEIQQLYNQQIVGKFQQRVSCSSMNSGVLQTIISMGVVKAVFVGHDHTNDFCGNLEGIWFCYGGGFGYHGYGKAGWPRRARIILAELEKGEKSWMGVERISTWKRLDDEKLSKLDEQVLWQSHPSFKMTWLQVSTNHIMISSIWIIWSCCIFSMFCLCYCFLLLQ